MIAFLLATLIATQQQPARADLSVEQLPRPHDGADGINQVAAPDRQPARVTQLPADTETVDPTPNPEAALEDPTDRSPRKELYREVAAVWEAIRRRGQQPTPELIAREIGPDNLARFLSAFPGSEAMFGIDSDQLPIDAPPPPQPPEKGK
jgi:hypothetical protein